MAYEFELLDVISREQLSRLQERYAGSRLYVPRFLSAEHTLVRLIGWPAAKILSEKYAGNLFAISRSQLVRRRNDHIRADRAWGLPPRLVARKYGLTTRSVRRICQGERMSTPHHFGLRRRLWQAGLQGCATHDRTHRHPDQSHG